MKLTLGNRAPRGEMIPFRFVVSKAKIGSRFNNKQLAGLFMVPKKGLEPPHPCEYVDLNHARLPIPPLRHSTCSVVSN